ncbi:MAG TPA: dimethylamine monooxygenase subunit DmmA family protein [Bacillales bacterium]
MSGHLKFIPGKRHYLLFADNKGMSPILPIVHKLIENELPFELCFQEDRESAIIEKLSNQKMGCYLYAAGRREWVDRIDEIAGSIGFSGEEMQIMAIGDRKNVFCFHCHTIQEISDQQLSCSECGMSIVVSKHFSKHHKAYLGYPAPDQEEGDHH